MNKKHSLSFLMEHIIILGVFALCMTICVSIFTSAYKKNEKANKAKEALEIATRYIEENNYKNKLFNESDIDFEVNDKGDLYSITASYGDEELFSIEFYGGEYE